MAVARGRNGADAAYEQARTAVVKIGIPREVKNNEFRVGITPVGVHELVNHGHTVYIEKDAGVGSSITDEDFVGQGAQILDSADDVWGESDMVMKVKEPVAEEYHRLREDLLLYTYLHLAADEPLTEELVAKKVTAVAYETVQLPSGMLPLLYPMSEVAGCLAPQVGAMALLRANGGRGVLMGGVGGVANSKVVVLGAGVAGQNAANIALGMGADVTLLDTDLDKLRMSFWRYDNRVHQIASSSLSVREQVLQADLVIGTVLIPGAKAPKLVTDDMVAQMKPGSVLVDLAIENGGNVQGARLNETVVTEGGVSIVAPANLPGRIAADASALYARNLVAFLDLMVTDGAVALDLEDEILKAAVVTHGGAVVHEGVRGSA